MSQSAASLSAVWEQTRQVRARLAGGPWHQRFIGPVPLPAWLVDIVDGNMDAYVGPDPVLCRTAGIGLQWFVAVDDHPDQLEVTGAHGGVDHTVLRTAADLLADAGGIVDADGYVWGDGHADGLVTVRVHALFGIFAGRDSTGNLVEQLDTIRDHFIVSVRRTAAGHVAQLVPRLPLAPGGL